MGFMFRDAWTTPSGIPPFKIPNTDQTRDISLGYSYTDLPFAEGACPVGPEPSTFHFTMKNYQFFLAPDVSIEQAEELGNVSPFKPLIRM